MYKFSKELDRAARLKFLQEDVQFFISEVDNLNYDLLFIIKQMHPMIHSHFVDSIFADDNAFAVWLNAVEDRDERTQRAFLKSFLKSILHDLTKRL